MSKRELSSRERMMKSLNIEESDYIPCCFMIFTALENRCATQFDFIERQLELGLDVKVDMPDLPVPFHPDVKVREWKAQPSGEPYPLLYKEYQSAAGTLTAVVQQTPDWPYADQVPLFDDYLIPRSGKFLVTCPEDLPALRYLLAPLTDDDIRDFHDQALTLKRYAADKGLLVAGGWRGFRGGDPGAMGVDALMWLCGMRESILWALEQPDSFEELVSIIGDWNLKRMEVILDVGVELFIKRAWYESTDFWSPDLYRRFMLPYLKKEVEIAHQAEAKFGYIMTSGVMPLLDMLLESGIDALIGVDPIQGKGTDMAMLKQKVGSRICLWGGVNGFLTVEMGSKQDIERAVEEAVSTLAPGGGFILSPVDNVRDESEAVWQNVLALVEAWKKTRVI